MNNSGMDPAASGTQQREQRLLAAIVFTDVVGFSKLASKNEARVYVALQRDMGVMSDLCRAHGGTVVNTMGDGMLMCFPSAVDALAGALEIQRTLANQSKSLPASDVLHHRIGVHLGDVIMSGDNVFGDGVNTAARLQNDARPDSIWFSKTVWEVVKNKIKFEARYVGKRMFKNLGEPVEVWEIPPITEAHAQRLAEAAGYGVPQQQSAQEGATGGKALFLVLISVVMVSSLIFFGMKLRPAQVAPPPVDNATVVATEEGADAAPVEPPSAGDSGQQPNGETALTAEQFASRMTDLRSRYAFAEISTFLAGEGSALPNAQRLRDQYGELAQMRAWLEAELAASTPANMVAVSMSFGDATIYAASGGNAFYRVGMNDWQPFQYTQLQPGDFRALASTLAQQPKSGRVEPRAERWIGIFSAEYGL
jgi:class 3 adenylate cyclase